MPVIPGGREGGTWGKRPPQFFETKLLIFLKPARQSVTSVQLKV